MTPFETVASIAVVVLMLLFSIDWTDVDKQPEPVGYGYSLRSIAFGTNLLVADLQLNKKSSVFGPDIDQLRLFARYVDTKFPLVWRFDIHSCLCLNICTVEL
ncbi:hypothetical protein HanRHA438_Chr09g0405751 [Helianthus annuus]|nr:hypothetical protein HanHA300_Chr09g0323281 [Helianthus annuus]KAJ0542836.1 hypothetical protein HanHA89_Chr09g0344211 [Helianthus annuus]KAJ0707890.1 hypothetical protein HanLR1_Chr09g0323531 [Helianthus annuus]KAJ0711868.1 hypothetical protein HanOQP8_Chr09g0328661 [Helianthus annuus]KAJ0799320.1 hypothetical protein HanLR1_Chr00c2060g0832611 [Helianthus annuus]